MHIISGIYKGIALKVPAGIRPTEDRVRKALFDILGDMSGLSFLELFAGSGSVGLEALSQGAQSVVFIEKDRKGIHAIEANIAGLKRDSDKAVIEVYQDDGLDAVLKLARRSRRFDVIFADPPYYKGLSEKILQSLDEYDILNHISGFLIIQHFKKDPLPSKQGNLVLFKQSKYGDTVLSFFNHP
ncbi:MAG: 16S rRNA (guanine(966)-N(2))-methyltransferase RsmD [Candidatus Omnitrophota bacterium]